MTVRQYIGARYVPLFADPIQWDSTSSYEPLTVVMNQGTSYVSKQSVPAGIEITNETYWLRWADYNAQLEEYIRQVQTYSASISALNDALPIANFDDDATVKDAIDGIAALLPGTDFTSENTVKDVIDALDTAIDERFDIIEADSWVDTVRIADSAVTSGKIADGAVTNGKIADGAVTRNKIPNYTIVESNTAVPILLILGDSWCAFDEGFDNWSTIVTNGMRCSVKQYAVGGTGWYHIGGTNVVRQGNFTSQLEYAYNQMTSEEKSRVKWIVVIGGVNDLNTESGYSLISAYTHIHDSMVAFRTKLDQLSASYTKPIVYAGFNAPYAWYKSSDNFANKMLSLERKLITEAVKDVYFVPIENMNWLLYSQSNMYRSDNLHPNQYGARAVGEVVLATIQGGGIDAIFNGQASNFTMGSYTINWNFTFKNGTLFNSFGNITGNANTWSDVSIPTSGWGVVAGILKLVSNNNYVLLFDGNMNNNGMINIHKDLFSIIAGAHNSTSYCPNFVLEVGNMQVN